MRHENIWEMTRLYDEMVTLLLLNEYALQRTSSGICCVCQGGGRTTTTLNFLGKQHDELIAMTWILGIATCSMDSVIVSVLWSCLFLHKCVATIVITMFPGVLCSSPGLFVGAVIEFDVP
jgi:hypothetical protein